MLKRTNSYLLLALLVITGFAGRINDNSLTGKERKFLITELKDSKKAFVESVKGLSEEQLNWKADSESWSVKECAYHIALSEKNLWDMVSGALKADANPEKRANIKTSDEDLIKMMSSRSFKVKTSEKFEPASAPFKSMEEAMEDFKDKRSDLVKYAKTTTEDLRNHVIESPLGTIDSYQMILMLSAHSTRHTKQIEEVKANPKFPK